MRFTRPLALLVALACQGEGSPAKDSTAAALDGLPAPLTAASVAGTWHGRSLRLDVDSVVARWLAVRLPGGDGRILIEGTTDSIRFTTTFDGDSMVSESEPYRSTVSAGAPRITFRSVGRMEGERLVGTSVNRLVDHPDSIVNRTRWVADRRR